MSVKNIKLEKILALGAREVSSLNTGSSGVRPQFCISVIQESVFPFSISFRFSSRDWLPFCGCTVLSSEGPYISGVCTSPPSKPSTTEVHFVFSMIWPFTAWEREGFVSSYSISSTASYPHVSYLCSNKAASACRTDRKRMSWVECGSAIIWGKKRGPFLEEAHC